MPKTAPTARGTAVALLNGVLGEHRLLSEMNGLLAPLAPADRAAAQRLATETLRHLDRVDRVLATHLRRVPPLPAHNVLRIATYELCNGGTPHGVVNAAVDLLGASRATQTHKGLANAVLRKVAQTGPEAWGKGRPPRMPRWLREPLLAAWGAQAVANIERVQSEPTPLDLTAKTDPDAVAKATGGALLATGSVRLRDYGQVSALPGFDSGDWWVQDMAAALPVRLLGDVSGLRVLDMCAAPGGKTLQLAAAGAEVTALDISAARLKRVRENLDRTGLSAHLVEGDALTHRGDYDAILLDAPCSATGTIRRHPDLPHARSGEGISELIAQQAAMLDHALGLLAPGGRLVFCTCSLLPDEGECHVDDLLARRSDVSILPAVAEGIEERWRSSEGGLRLRPDFLAAQGGMDGFYMVVLQKSA